jgi:hypothetical protein
MDVHEQYAIKYYEELDRLSERLPLGREPSPEQRDAISDRIWSEVTAGREHSCSNCSVV